MVKINSIHINNSVVRLYSRQWYHFFTNRLSILDWNYLIILKNILKNNLIKDNGIHESLSISDEKWNRMCNSRNLTKKKINTLEIQKVFMYAPLKFVYSKRNTSVVVVTRKLNIEQTMFMYQTEQLLQYKFFSESNSWPNLFMYDSSAQFYMSIK